jgi:hypothetical protein
MGVCRRHRYPYRRQIANTPQDFATICCHIPGPNYTIPSSAPPALPTWSLRNPGMHYLHLLGWAFRRCPTGSEFTSPNKTIARNRTSLLFPARFPAASRGLWSGSGRGHGSRNLLVSESGGRAPSGRRSGQHGCATSMRPEAPLPTPKAGAFGYDPPVGRHSQCPSHSRPFASIRGSPAPRRSVPAGRSHKN